MDFSPRTYPIVRGRSALDVTVSNRDQLLDLRVELELVRQFGAWARPELLAVLEAEAARSRSGCCGRFRSWFRKLAGQGDRMAEDRKARLEDMCAILYSALQPVNAEALARIDCEFPDIAGELDMKRMKKESKDFKADVAAELPVDTDTATELKEIVQELDESLQDEPCVVQDQSQVVSSASDSEESSGIANDLDALLAEVQAETDEVLGEPEPVALDAAEDSSEDPSSVPEVITDVEGAMDEDPVQSVIPTPDGEEAIELATDSMADELVRHQEHLDAVASVFSEATQEIEDMAESINEVVGADEYATTAEDEITTPAAECSDDALPSPMRDDFPANGMATGIGSITQELRQEIESLKAGVLTQLDRAAALIEQMDGTYQRLEAMTSQATQWQQALEEAHQAGQRFAATQMAAITAREDFEQAQTRADDACRMWHAANEKSVAEACVAVQS